VLVAHESITADIVDAAINIHRRHGPGLLESAYEAVLEYELLKRGLSVERHVRIDLTYDDLVIPSAYCADLIVNGCVVIELKACETKAPVHWRQLMTYLKLTGLRVGLLLNFGQPTMKEGIQRITNGY
jgi:GxxExxY protein